MSRIFFRLVVVALAAGMFGPLGHTEAQPKKPDKLETLMKKKLTHAQKVLEGVAQGEFDTIAKHARELSDLSKQAEWKVLGTPLYQLYTDEFRQSADDLQRHAKKKNIDAAALSYVEMTLVCVKCHKHVRERRMARTD